MTRARWVVLAVIAALVAAFFALHLNRYFTLEQLQASRATLVAWRDANPLLSSVTYFALYVTVATLSLPGAAILTLAAGAIFGLLWGVLLVSFASSIGATLAMLAARFVLRDAVQALFGD
jgi:uncharacterized membrane protein YdjX (TVP38/TMEM64 family)